MTSTETAEPRRRTIDLPERGGTMAALEFGPSDQPIAMVFSHANGFNALTYRALLAPLAARRRILAIDLRGHGHTRLPTITEGRRSWEDIRDDLLALCAKEDLGDSVLAGHSMGATTSLLAAAEAPGRVRSLVLAEPVIVPRADFLAGTAGEPEDSVIVQGGLRRRAVFDSREAVLEAFTGRGPFKRWTSEMLADYVADGVTDRPDGTVELACAPAWEVSNYLNQNHDSWGALARVRCPVRILKAAQHSTFQLAPELDALIDSGRVGLETVEGASHFLPMEYPERVQAALRAALGQGG